MAVFGPAISDRFYLLLILEPPNQKNPPGITWVNSGRVVVVMVLVKCLTLYPGIECV